MFVKHITAVKALEEGQALREGGVKATVRQAKDRTVERARAGVRAPAILERS